MRHRMTGRRYRGFSLIEIMLVMTISTLILTTVVMVYTASLRVWRVTSSRSYAYPPAYRAITRIHREVKNAYQVSIGAGGTDISFTVPRTDSSGVNITPLQPGRTITYYLANDTGTRNTPGTVLWRYEVQCATQQSTRRRIADNVEGLHFEQVNTQDGRVYALYSSTVTTLGEEGWNNEYRSTFATAIAFRNPSE